MWFRSLDGRKLAVQPRRPYSQLGSQMAPLVKQLAVRLRKLPGESPLRNLGGVEPVSTPLSLRRDASQERSHNGHWVVLRLEAKELRMMTVASGHPSQNLLCEERLSPGCDQPLGVEVSWMNRP